ncbi:DUF4846 domain-containing protein [Flavobacteriaceae bacterium TK19130]|nr:DUF4846 domain-containing protein [Thermobacterium salinum]
MKKIVLALVLVLLIAYLFFPQQTKTFQNVAKSYILPSSNLSEEGRTVRSRVTLPEGWTRFQFEEGSFQAYLQKFPLKEFDSKIINYDGRVYPYQKGHVGVLEVSVPDNGLQQCADALIRLRAEYLWERGRQHEIAFNFTSGHRCSWKAYAKGFRPKVKGNSVSFHKTAAPDASKENFYRYLNLVYTYAGTQSLYDELKKVKNVSDLTVGDMLVYPGFPGHIIMIVDMAYSATGKKMVIFAQGNTPAQSVHILRNMNDSDSSPWYEAQVQGALRTPAYLFEETTAIRFNP